MTLVSGTKLGPYEIVAPLGAGGMGEVYRARDTRLGRDVAIKTLPPAAARDPERRARFESEARAVAALSHPNVLAIHDVGAEGEVVFAVMELVEGETLRERLIDGAMPTARALPLAIQLANGLAAAHDRGIIHRDLKPDNIIITADGRAKLLDFGLARFEAPADGGSHSMLPTVAVGTQPGMVLGTIGYMSPEQVRGQVADARSDLFALGAVLYEMLAGRRAFRADSPADTMTAILREDPVALTTLVPELPPALERIVHRCLEKLPASRFRSAADLAFALETISVAGSSGAAAASAAAAPRPLAFTRLTYRNGYVSGARFTPDGASVVYGASWEGRPTEIFSSRPGNPESRGLGLPPASLLAMSVSGEMALSIGYEHTYWMRSTGALARVSLAGGGVRPLQKEVGGADWSPDGRTMAVVRDVAGRCRLEYPAGTLLLETAEWFALPRVSPDGRHVAFVRHVYQGDSGGQIELIDTGGISRVLLPGLTSISGLRWSPSGDEVWWSGIDETQRHGIWGLRLDGSRRTIHVSANRIALHDIARDGRVLASIGDLRAGFSVGGDEDSRELDLSWFDGSIANDLSPDGRRVLFSEVDEAENPHYACFLRELDGSPAVRLGVGIGYRLSPDGEWALAIALRPRNVVMLYPTGFGESREIPIDGVDALRWAGFHPDGRQLFLVAAAGERKNHLFRCGLEGGRPELLWDEELNFDWVRGLPVSPDGDRLVLRRLSGQHVAYSCRTRAVEPLPSLEQDAVAVGFDTTGKSLFVSRRGGMAHSIERLDLATGARTHWRTLSPPDPTGIFYMGAPVVTPDGSRYAYGYIRQSSHLYIVDGLS